MKQKLDELTEFRLFIAKSSISNKETIQEGRKVSEKAHNDF